MRKPERLCENFLHRFEDQDQNLDLNGARDHRFPKKLTIRSIKHEIIPVVFPIRQRYYPRRKCQSHWHVPRRRLMVCKRRRLEIIPPIIARERLGSDGVLLRAVHSDIRQALEHRDGFVVFAQAGEIFRRDVGPTAIRWRIKNVDRLNVWEPGQELVKLRDGGDDCLAVIFWP